MEGSTLSMTGDTARDPGSCIARPVTCPLAHSCTRSTIGIYDPAFNRYHHIYYKNKKCTPSARSKVNRNLSLQAVCDIYIISCMYQVNKLLV